MKSVFEFTTYKGYLRATLASEGKRSGRQLQVARFLNCQSAHVSQVLNGHSHFSLEHAAQLNSFLGHNQDESLYFVLLVSRERAGNKELRAHYDQQMAEIQKRRSLIKNRVQSNVAILPEHQTKYYSSWHYAALHIALSIPELQDKEALAEYFRLPLSVVSDILDFLTSIGLAVRENLRYRIGPSHIHLGQDEANISKHHFNWRLQAMDSLSRVAPTDIHYSVVVSLSREDAGRIREKFLKVIRENLDLVAPSKEEVLYTTAIDFFEVKR